MYVHIFVKKNYRHNVVYINIASKPKWFLERNPTGKVPVIQVRKGIYLLQKVFTRYLKVNRRQLRVQQKFGTF
jgi:hypothetical protein